jgi:hypothetical protein
MFVAPLINANSQSDDREREREKRREREFVCVCVAGRILHTVDCKLCKSRASLSLQMQIHGCGVVDQRLQDTTGIHQLCNARVVLHCNTKQIMLISERHATPSTPAGSITQTLTIAQQICQQSNAFDTQATIVLIELRQLPTIFANIANRRK